MVQPTQKELIQSLEAVQKELGRIQNLVAAFIPEKEWYTSQEFAAKSGIKAKTVSNYCGKGRFKRLKKTDNGQYLIHKSELEKWKS